MLKTNLASLILLVLLHAYVFWRAGTVPAVKRWIPLIWRLIIPVVLFVLFYTGCFGSFVVEWIALLLISFLLALVIDIVTGFGFFLPRLAGRIRGIVMAGGLLYAAMAMVQGMRPPEVNEYEVTLDGLPAELNGTVVAAVADLHVDLLTQPDWLQRRVGQILAMEPDIILLLGDIIETRRENREAMIEIMSTLCAPLGVWGVMGNHEYHHGGYDYNAQAYEQAGIEVLRNRWAEIRPGFVLAGVDYLGLREPETSNEENFHRALEDRPDGATILLSHAPVQIDQAANAGVQLMLSGHTHGGQVWPLNYVAGWIYDFVEGRYETGGMTAIVSRGAGTWGPRMRLWRAGEILKITLKSG